MHPSMLQYFTMESVETRQLRKRITFPFFPLIKNSKVRWMKKTQILERKLLAWHTVVDRMTGHQVKSDPKTRWILESIVDEKD